MIKNQQAEQSVIGTLLIEGSLMNVAILSPEHFAEKRHGMIFKAMRTIYDANEPVNIVTVTTALKDKIKEVGNVTYLTELSASIPTTSTFKHHQRLVLEAYRHRKAREAAVQYVKDPGDQAYEALRVHIESNRELGKEKKEKSTRETLVEITRDMNTPIKDGLTGYSTGYKELDQLTGGVQKGDLMILAARPSMGKTAFALTLAAHHCKQGGSSQIFSLEMGQKPLMQRIITTESLVDGHKWRSRDFNKQDYIDVMNIIGPISEWALHMDTQARTVGDIRAKIRSQIQKGKNDRHLVIIDYLQLISSAGRSERRDLEIGLITRELKLLATELDIPIILLSQLSRGVEQRQDKRPVMSDLRESGNIEQDADLIAFLYRADYYKWQDKEDEIELIISKQRNGPVGKVKLRFLKEYGKFIGVPTQLSLSVREDTNNKAFQSS
ncbi:replicative DNA helicase [Halobacillus salinarum]|uniref:Replicative DNA helicase n=1 Tax=Halobacillus salinarum TaxID=2932257 RepID=A0ABY4EL65_9BACI|nr:replicative DNA helicase [Halobacillus salinarum]UOQ44848.1 replicative DNA helicase [Halobacillus salinarum]